MKDLKPVRFIKRNGQKRRQRGPGFKTSTVAQLGKAPVFLRDVRKGTCSDCGHVVSSEVVDYLRRAGLPGNEIKCPECDSIILI